MIPSSYADEAEKFSQSPLTKLKTSYTEEIFTPNVHEMPHLAWLVRSFGPLLTTSAMVFESANYLLKPKFKGTVNHPLLLLESYVRDKDTYRGNIRNSDLADLARKKSGKRKFCSQTIVAGIPNDVLQERE